METPPGPGTHGTVVWRGPGGQFQGLALPQLSRSCPWGRARADPLPPPASPHAQEDPGRVPLRPPPLLAPPLRHRQVRGRSPAGAARLPGPQAAAGEAGRGAGRGGRSLPGPPTRALRALVALPAVHLGAGARPALDQAIQNPRHLRRQRHDRARGQRRLHPPDQEAVAALAAGLFPAGARQLQHRVLPDGPAELRAELRRLLPGLLPAAGQGQVGPLRRRPRDAAPPG